MTTNIELLDRVREFADADGWTVVKSLRLSYDEVFALTDMLNKGVLESEIPETERKHMQSSGRIRVVGG